MEETVRRVGGDRPLMVGDRLDTDIEGAHAIDVPSLLVLTGVSWLEDLVAATPEVRPTYISPTLEGLFEPHPVPRRQTAGGRARRLDRAASMDGRLAVEGSGSDADWWRVVATACWLHLDASGTPSTSATRRRPGGSGASG